MICGPDLRRISAFWMTWFRCFMYNLGMDISDELRLEIKVSVSKILRAADEKESARSVKKKIFQSNPEWAYEFYENIRTANLTATLNT